jgi:sugar phosphate isomerase/epimerase
MRLGVSSYAFGWAVAHRGFAEADLLAFAVAHRVPVIQFGDHVPLHTRTDAELDAFAARARAAGVAIETGARGLTSAHLARYIVIDGPGHEPTAADVVATIRAALPALRATDVVLGIENHDRFPCATLRRIIDDVADPRVGVCLDTANSLGAGEGIGEVLTQLAPVCVNLHVKDYAIARVPYLMGFTVTGRALGEGSLPLAFVLAAVALHGRCTTAVVETWPPPEPELADTLAKELRWAESSTAALRAALASP